MQRFSSDSGFSLTELTTTLAIIGVISAALIAVMTNLNTQSERMNSQTELLMAGTQILDQIEPWAALAGHKETANALSAASAVTMTGSTVTFCFDTDAATRQRREFRVSDKRLQTRSETNDGCTPAADSLGWENISDQVLSGITFSNIFGDDHSLDVKLELEKIVPGTDETVRTTIRRRFNMFAMTGL